ncbi:MAG TPA: diacylglycerol kinase family protein [Miltoncostaeaceae bacterium]|nr:diacylglycerol kinase family protein [Miltoncostaeaceae bacterium]
MTALRPLALVVNPAATRSGRGVRAEVARALAPLGLEWSLVTSGPGDAARLAREAADEGAAVVVSLGGDGVAGEVAGALAGGPVAMAPLPGGNANVFSRALGWPNSAHAALPMLAAALAAGRLREAGLGLLRIGGPGGGERVFAVNAGVGLDAATVEWIEARPRTKRRLRQAGFILGAAIAAGRAGRAPHLRATADGGEAVLARAVLAACGTPYTYLGRRPLDLVPGAAFDGRLAWVGLTRIHPAQLARLGLRAARGRDLPIGSGALAGGTIVRELVIESDVAAPLQADGEPLGRHREVRVGPGPVLRAIEPRPG